MNWDIFEFFILKKQSFSKNKTNPQISFPKQHTIIMPTLHYHELRKQLKNQGFCDNMSMKRFI